MAVLSDQERRDVRVQFCDRLSERREFFDLTKVELDAAIAATDDWIEANAAAFNQALPLPARAELTAAQKSELFSLVALRRYGVQL